MKTIYRNCAIKLISILVLRMILSMRTRATKSRLASEVLILNAFKMLLRLQRCSVPVPEMKIQFENGLHLRKSVRNAHFFIQFKYVLFLMIHTWIISSLSSSNETNAKLHYFFNVVEGILIAWRAPLGCARGGACTRSPGGELTRKAWWGFARAVLRRPCGRRSTIG